MPCMRAVVPGSMGRAEISHGGTSESGTRSIAAVRMVSPFPACRRINTCGWPTRHRSRALRTRFCKVQKIRLFRHEMVIGLEDLRREPQSTCFQSTIPNSKRHFISYLRRMPQGSSVPRQGINGLTRMRPMLGSRPIPNSGRTISRLGHGLHHAALQG